LTRNSLTVSRPKKVPTPGTRTRVRNSSPRNSSNLLENRAHSSRHYLLRKETSNKARKVRKINSRPKAIPRKLLLLCGGKTSS